MNAPLPFAERSAATRTATRIASLCMYDLPELEEANDRIWTAIAQRLHDDGVAGLPRRLTRGAPLNGLWTDPNLLLAQACGYPLVTALAGQVRFVATPRYAAPGCRGPFHRSAVVVRVLERTQNPGELAGARLALNDPASGTGMNLLRALVAPLAGGRPFFGEVAITGSHLASAEAVAGGAADVAALDAVTWAHLGRLRPTLAAQLRVLTWSAESPGLPLITARNTDEATLAALHRALTEVARDPRLARARRDLLLDGFSDLPETRYLSALHWKRFAADLGYPELR